MRTIYFPATQNIKTHVQVTKHITNPRRISHHGKGQELLLTPPLGAFRKSQQLSCPECRRPPLSANVGLCIPWPSPEGRSQCWCFQAHNRGAGTQTAGARRSSRGTEASNSRSRVANRRTCQNLQVTIRCRSGAHVNGKEYQRTDQEVTQKGDAQVDSPIFTHGELSVNPPAPGLQKNYPFFLSLISYGVADLSL